MASTGSVAGTGEDCGVDFSGKRCPRPSSEESMASEASTGSGENVGKDGAGTGEDESNAADDAPGTDGTLWHDCSEGNGENDDEVARGTSGEL